MEPQLNLLVAVSITITARWVLHLSTGLNNEK
jgi:hypothetical protein